MSTVDVAVVGAGPAGSATAALLAQQGYEVVLLERRHMPRPKACAEYMSPGVEDVLRRLNLFERVRQSRPQPVLGMQICAPSGAILTVGYRRGASPVAASTLPRQVLDSALVEEAVARGVQVREGFIVRAPLMDRGRVVGIRGSTGGKSCEVRARMTVVADGARSTLARALGIARSPRWPVRIGLVAHFEGADLPRGYGQMHVTAWGYCGVAPLPGGLANVAMVLPLTPRTGQRESAETLFHRWIDSVPALREQLKHARRISGIRGLLPVGSRAARASVPGAILVGDAAGFFDPFTGEGIYRALVGAEMAAQALHAALSGTSDEPETLTAYGSARNSAFRAKSAVTALVQLFVRYPALLEYAVPRLSARSAPLETLGNVLGDIQAAQTFLSPRTLWSALRP